MIIRLKKLKVETKDLGIVEINEKDIIHFPRGLYGFENSRNFVLFNDNKNDNQFMWLQCTDSCEPRFVVIDPFSVIKDYKVSPEAAKQLIPLEDDGDLRMLVITTVTAGAKEIYVNFKCPIIINVQDNTAAQMILDNDDYPIRYYLFKREG